MTPPLHEQMLTVAPGRALHVTTRQAEAPVTLFFVHGGGGNKNQWRRQFAHFLPQHVNIVAWDAFGHGKSQHSKREQDFSADAFLRDFSFIFEKFRTEKTIIIAHSFGCRITLAWLLQVWTRRHVLPVDGLVLLGPAPHENKRRGLFGNWMDHLPLPVMEILRPQLGRRFEALAWHPGTDPALLAFERNATRHNSLFMMRSLLRQGPVFPAAALKALPAVPVTLIAGAHDGIVPHSTVEKLADSLPGAEVHTLDECAHQIMLEKPDEVNMLTDAMLARVNAGRA
ncbi:alpha/beta fold hydrolase [Acetobacter thailandicus]|uniref:alpha/beta fold hydrolase n=1 Tax=Acetobacter thailandicus TaxID=1502842 RepID=UPI001BA6C4C2|nr:alpha/beta hydrolase [Acetobacter thailandicus]MBS1003923.1 alpha/beta fold hydrolase [Acetobacter thailandicus]